MGFLSHLRAPFLYLRFLGFGVFCRFFMIFLYINQIRTQHMPIGNAMLMGEEIRETVIFFYSFYSLSDVYLNDKN